MPSIYVDVDLSMFDDEEIAEEYEARGLGDGPTPSEDRERLEAIYHAMRMGHKDKAYDLMYDYVRDKLGRAI